jgi:hypothetical protein
MKFSRIIIAAVLLSSFAICGNNVRWLLAFESAVAAPSEADAVATIAADGDLSAAGILAANTPVTIYYTTNGTVPTAASLPTTATADNTPPEIKVRAGDKELDTASANGVTLPANIVFSANEPATIYYTTNGTDPTTATSTYAKIGTAGDSADGPTISGIDSVLVTLGEDTAGNLSPVQSYTFFTP